MAYDYLNKPTTPRLVREALALMGTKEIKGSVNNKTIISWAAEIGGDVDDVYKADEIPWCGLFAGVCAKRATWSLPKSPLWALSWATFGNSVNIGQEQVGDILVFVRKGGGHVGIYVGEDDTAYHVLGGNQGDMVCITRIAKNRIYAVRRPPYKIPPVGAVKVKLKPSGALSTNEA